MNFATVAVIVYVMVMLALFSAPVKILFKRYFTKDGCSQAEFRNKIKKFEQYYGLAKFAGVTLALALVLIKAAFFS